MTYARMVETKSALPEVLTVEEPKTGRRWNVPTEDSGCVVGWVERTG